MNLVFFLEEPSAREMLKGLLPRVLPCYGNASKYRIPDRIHYPAIELKKITRDAYQKISGSRSIGPMMSMDSNKSHSFRVFIEGVQQAIRDAIEPNRPYPG